MFDRIAVLFLAAFLGLAPAAKARGCMCGRETAAETAPCCCTGEDVCRCAGCTNPTAPEGWRTCSCNKVDPQATVASDPPLAPPTRLIRLPARAPNPVATDPLERREVDVLPPARCLPLLL